MMYLHWSFHYAGDPDAAPVQQITVTFQAPVFSYSDRNNNGNDEFQRSQTGTSSQRLDVDLSDSSYEAALPSAGLAGTGAAVRKFHDYTAAIMRQGEAAVSRLAFPVRLQLSAAECEVPYAGVFSCLYFVKGLNADGQLAEPVGDHLFLVNKQRYDEVLPAFQQITNQRSRISLLAFLKLLAEENGLSPQGPVRPESVINDRLPAIVHGLHQENVDDVVDFLKRHVFALFDFGIEVDALEGMDIAGHLHVATDGNRQLAMADLYFYALDAEYTASDIAGNAVYRHIAHDWRQGPGAPVDNRIAFTLTGEHQLLRNSVRGAITVRVRGFDGAELWRRDFAADDPQLKEVQIELAEHRPPAITPGVEHPAGGAKRLRGKLVGLSKACPLNDAVVLVQAKADGDAAWRVVGHASADSNGNFSMPYPYGAYAAAQALVSLAPDSPADIPVVQGTPNETIAPDFLFLLVKDPVCPDAETEKKADCDCAAPVKAGRLPSQEDLINSDEYTQDIGGSCVNLSTPNRTLSEYNYTGIVRTSDPDVANYTLRKRTLTTLQGEEVSGFELEGGAGKIARQPVNLDNPIRWQDTPADQDYLSFYQAVTVATGHILHYKSVFKADGYSLGNLLYSLPLAPGQKKQIVVFDSSHALQGAESQSLSQGERLAADIVAERGIADELSGFLGEAMQGRSSASTSGVSAGLGLGGSLGVVSGSLGVAGGTASSSSSASQNSSRNTSQFFAEKLRQAVMQNADSYRQLNASVVTSVQEGQHYNATTEVVGNHNHCHSLTMMYFEVLRHFAVFQELVQVEECVFVPLLMTNFTMENIRKWADVLAVALLPAPSNTYLRPFSWVRRHPLLAGFDANERIRTNYAHVDFPAGRYCDEAISDVKGSFSIRMVLPRPKTKFDRILSLPIIRKTVTTQAGVDVQGTIRDNIKSSAIAAATGGLSLLFGGGPSVKYETETHDVLTPGKIFDLFMTLDENYEAVSPAHCIRVHTFEDQKILVNGTLVTIDFFHGMPDDRKIWDAYADVLDMTTLELLNKFANNVIADWDRIFFSDIAPQLVSRLIHESTVALKPFSSLDITALNRYSSREQLLRYNFQARSTSARAAIGAIEVRYQPGVGVAQANWDTLKRELTVVLESLNVNYATPHYNGRIFSGYVGNDLFDGVTQATPMNSDEQRSPRKEDVFLVNKLTEHLNSNLEHYNKALWYRLDPDRRYMLLDGFSIQVYDDGGAPLVFRSLASVVKNELVCVTGNSLVFPVAPGYRVSQSYIVQARAEEEDAAAPLFDHYRPLTAPPPFRISVPSRGVFLEAVQGACDACEKVKDNSSQDWVRFATDEPSPIAPLTPPTPTITDWKAAFKDFATPLINIQNAPAAPAPGAGLAGLADLLGKAGVFKDITGLDANQQNVIRTYLSNQENAKAFAEMAQKLSMQGHNTANSDKIMDTIKSARQDGAISQDDYGKLVKEHLQKQIDGGDKDNAASEKDAASKSSLASAAVRAVDQGKNVKAQKSDTDGNSESIEVTPGGADQVLASVPGTVPRMKQENSMACWATVAAMMVSWKEGRKMTVQEVLQKAGAQYVAKFENQEGLASSEKDAFIGALGMRGEAPASYSVQQYIDWVKDHGPLWITTDAADADGQFSPHARVVTKITGTGSADGSGTSFVFIDPASGTEISEPFSKFLSAYEQMVTDNPGALFIQIVHFGGAAGGGGEGAAPLPAWADAVDPFPGSVALSIDRGNVAMNAAFAPVAGSTSNHLCAALADVTGAPASAPFAGLHDDEMVYAASLLKVGVMYAAFALRARVQAFADAAKANGITAAPELFSLIKRAWTPKLKATFPARSATSFKNGQDVTIPQFAKLFTLSAAGKIEFAAATTAISDADLDAAGEFGAPVGRFHEWMRLMMRWSNNAAASRCVLALGYFYINGLFAKAGFFDAATGKGLWISGDYTGHDWVKSAAEQAANAAGVALAPRWATAQGRTKSNFVANALQVGRLMTAMAQDKLVDAAACTEMRTLASQLAGGIGSYAESALSAAGRAPSALSSKIGFGDDSFSHDCAIIERTVSGKHLRYVAVVLGSAPAQHRSDLSALFVLLDTAVVARNP
ncbi:hypothetical protein ASC94_22315 [Massilia sp. Root418]|jgi:hypothetical protein|uniref:papain-like cysteine protease family protein n=1 Tax=Massilia sp. Root418 TaxID=1736532 RepID=UPI0006FCBACC|nr:papain-like cysteine protease family protein [Massilia sp. Root418]KQW89185.1 hypothetical protein ASC94_22315 [Massilia sp. Root418]